MKGERLQDIHGGEYHDNKRITGFHRTRDHRSTESCRSRLDRGSGRCHICRRQSVHGWLGQSRKRSQDIGNEPFPDGQAGLLCG